MVHRLAYRYSDILFFALINTEELLIKEIENLKENQTSVLNFGGGIAGLIITGLLTYNAYLFEYIGHDIKF